MRHNDRWARGFDDGRGIQVDPTESVVDGSVGVGVASAKSTGDGPIVHRLGIELLNRATQIDPFGKRRYDGRCVGHDPRRKLRDRSRQHVVAQGLGGILDRHRGADRPQTGHVTDNGPPRLTDRGQRDDISRARRGADQFSSCFIGPHVEGSRKPERRGRFGRRDRSVEGCGPQSQIAHSSRPVRAPLASSPAGSVACEAVGDEGGDVCELVCLVAAERQHRVIGTRHLIDLSR